MDKLIDTSVLIDFLRTYAPARSYLESLNQLSCSLVTAAELFQGCQNKRALLETKKLLQRFDIIPLTPEISQTALELIEKFSLSQGLEIPDALIAATALANDLTLVTANIKHFRFIPGLQIIDWPKATLIT